MSDFEPFQDKGVRRVTTSYPSATVNHHSIRPGKTVRERFFQDADHVEFLLDEANYRVGLRPIEDHESTPHAYKLSNGSTVKAKKVWERLGVSVPETTYVAVDIESEDFPVVDMSEFADDGGER